MDTLLSHDAAGEETSYSKMAEGGDAAVFKCKYLKKKRSLWLNCTCLKSYKVNDLLVEGSNNVNR